MIRKYLLPLLSIVGIVFAINVVLAGAKPIPAAAPVQQPAEAPFRSFVAGAGLVEASSENIAVGTGVSGVVTDVFVAVGSAVQTGDPLFKLRDRVAKAELAAREAALKVGAAKLARLEALPRPEDLPQFQARLAEAGVAAKDLEDEARRWERMAGQKAASEEDISRRRYAAEAAKARLAQAQSELDLVKAGAWQPDLAVARAEVAAAEADVLRLEAELDRLTIKSLVNGEVLQVKIRPGEFAQAGVLATPLMLVGTMTPLHVRVDVDEHDAWRLKPESSAIAYVRGNKELKTPIKFVRFEPYIVPKRSLTGESTERVDTRVLQVIYSFDRNALPVYVGQQMDVFIESR